MKNQAKLQDQNSTLPEVACFGLLIDAQNESESLHHYLQNVANVISNMAVSEAAVHVKIGFNGKSYQSPHFIDHRITYSHTFSSPDLPAGFITIAAGQPLNDEKKLQFETKWKALFRYIVPIVIGAISKFQLEKLMADKTEREKELRSINTTTQILKKGRTLEDSLQEICNELPEAMQFPADTAARIRFNHLEFTSPGFRETPWVLKQNFETPNVKEGCIEIFYLKEFPLADEGPFLHEERSLIANLAALISGSVSKESLQQLLAFNTERLKELKGLNRTSEILKESKSFDDALAQICTILPDSFQYTDCTTVRISYGKKQFVSNNFQEAEWKLEQTFNAPRQNKGLIEVFYTKAFPIIDEGPFLKEERNLLINMANLMAGSATREVFNKLQYANKERLKELRAINQTSKIIEEGLSIDETLDAICDILPPSWQYPKHTVARISFEGKSYTSENFKETPWVQREDFVTIDNKKGRIEIFYLKQMPKEDEGPFLSEERNLLINIGKLISGYLNNYKGREIFHKNVFISNQSHKADEFKKSLIKNKKPLQLYFNQQILDKYVYLDMMKYKIKHILFVAALYDAFVLESEDTFFEKFMGEIYQYSLFSLPRITGVATADEALELLETTHFDLVILMVGLDRHAPFILSEQIKQRNASLPVYLLLNKKSDLNYFETLVPTIPSVDKLFVWNGDSQILFAIVKSIEDKVNVENDTKVGLVRVILLIEDSPLYYSKYLQILYSIVFGQVQKLLPEVEKNELDKIAKMRSRPKILLARNYDEAITIFNKYKDFLLCVISDVEFERSGKMDKNAGIKFIKYIKSHTLDIPTILQSNDEKYETMANELNVHFINKNSETLLTDMKKYLTSYLGFGNFTFRDKEGNKLGVATSLREFEKLLREVPDESFNLHASENQLSLWLMSRGEIQLAKTLNPISIKNFNNLSESRQFFLDNIQKYKEEKKRGKILTFEETSTLDEKNIVSYSGGSLGGKGRGLAFIHTLIYNLDFSTLKDKINILTPVTVIIGTDEFQTFISKNKLLPVTLDQKISYQELRKRFVESTLSDDLIMKLSDFVSQISKPVAIRSSSISEDSITQPFAGVFDTYIVPCSINDKTLFLDRILTVIKLIFASVYSDKAKNYFSAIHHKIEEEKMAIILQELVGSQYGRYYYPHISGVAQSYNYYPVSHMKPEEGFAVAAVGLGSYVVDGWKSYRFSPAYPNVLMYSVKDILSSSQVQFYALDCQIEELDFLKDGELASLKMLDISEAEEHGTLTHCASVYNPNNDRIEPGLSSYGPRVINFANILQYKYIPLAETISVLLNTVKEAFGSPVEIEYAVDLNKTKNGLPTFYLLQIKPLVGNLLMQQFDLSELDKSKMVLYTKSSLGNGEISEIRDFIFAKKEKFNKLRTIEMTAEIEYLNNKMVKSDKYYVLIGPGRWGTRDRFIGIPVNWSQISNAKVIVEISLDNYPLDSSLGSHFFHNITSMNIGYFSVHHSSLEEFIQWEVLESQHLIQETEYFKHVRFEKPVKIYMDGIHRKSAIVNES